MNKENNEQKFELMTSNAGIENRKNGHPIWFGIGFTILPFIVLLIGFINVNPSIWRSIPNRVYEQSPPERDIAWREDERSKPPLKYLGDSFVFVSLETDTVEVESFWNLFETPSTKVHWKWKYEVTNLTEADREIEVWYYLIDQNGSELSAGSIDKKVAKTGQTITLEGQGDIPYDLVGAVVGSSWEIR